MRYVHTNIVARDWRALARFYEEVFACRRIGPQRDQSGEWLARGVGVDGVRLEGVHLLLPGYGPDGPTLEIYRYEPFDDEGPRRPNRRGLGHLAFRVDDVAPVLDAALAAGAQALGSISQAEIEGVGRLEFVYLSDPEGNVIEVQSWG